MDTFTHKILFWDFFLRVSKSTFSLSPTSLSVLSTPGVSNPAPGELLSNKFQLQPQSNTPEPANQGFKGYLLISDRSVGAGLELKSAGW